MNRKQLGWVALAAGLIGAASVTLVTAEQAPVKAKPAASSPKPVAATAAKPASEAIKVTPVAPAPAAMPGHPMPGMPPAAPAEPAGPPGKAQITETVYDAGTVERGSELSHAFTIKNVGTNPLTVDAKPG